MISQLLCCVLWIDIPDIVKYKYDDKYCMCDIRC
jgi:hypothetical protein